jgi:hypothetical protein
VRRSTRATLHTELARSGFRVLWLTHIFSWLVAPVLAKRRARSEGPELGLDVDSPVIERRGPDPHPHRAIGRRAGPPMGTSILCISTPTTPESSKDGSRSARSPTLTC